MTKTWIGLFMSTGWGRVTGEGNNCACSSSCLFREEGGKPSECPAVWRWRLRPGTYALAAFQHEPTCLCFYTICLDTLPLNDPSLPLLHSLFLVHCTAGCPKWCFSIFGLCEAYQICVGTVQELSRKRSRAALGWPAEEMCIGWGAGGGQRTGQVGERGQDRWGRGR